MIVAIDAVGIRGHGGAAVLSELLHWLPKVRPEWKWHIFLLKRHLREFDDPPVTHTVTVEHSCYGNSGIGRLYWVGTHLQERVRSIGANVLLSFANIGSSNPRIPQVVFIHQPNAFFEECVPMQSILKRLRLRFMRHQILRGAKASRAVIVQTKAMHDRILKFEPKLKERLHVIPSGYRTPSIHQKIRHEKRLIVDSAKRPRLIYISHPSEHKNHTMLVEALPGILKVFPDASLLLTLERNGPTNPRYASFVRDIYDKATTLGVNENIVWLGILSPDEVYYALSESDLMVFPSLSESFGLGLVEAMAAGCPITASDLAYAHDVAGKAAVYFDPLNPQDISHTVTSVLGNSVQKKRMIEEGMALKERYSYRNIAQDLASLLSSTAES